MTFLENDTLKLRPVEPADADFMWQVESDSSQWVQNALVAPFSRENLLSYACNYEADPFMAGQLRLIAVAKPDMPVGIVDLYEISTQHRNAFVGIYILPQYRGKGLGAQALKLLEVYADKLLNLRNLGSKIVDGNDVSMNLFLSAGYEWCGTLKNWILSGADQYSLHILLKEL